MEQSRGDRPHTHGLFVMRAGLGASRHALDDLAGLVTLVSLSKESRARHLERHFLLDQLLADLGLELQRATGNRDLRGTLVLATDRGVDARLDLGLGRAGRPRRLRRRGLRACLAVGVAIRLLLGALLAVLLGAVLSRLLVALGGLLRLALGLGVLGRRLVGCSATSLVAAEVAWSAMGAVLSTTQEKRVPRLRSAPERRGIGRDATIEKARIGSQSTTRTSGIFSSISRAFRLDGWRIRPRRCG